MNQNILCMKISVHQRCSAAESLWIYASTAELIQEVRM